MNIEDERCGKWAVLLSNCASQHVTLYRFHQIQVNLISYHFLIDNWVVNWRIIQSRKVRQTRATIIWLSSGWFRWYFFRHLFSPIYDFCAKFYFSAQMATMAIGNKYRICSGTCMLIKVTPFTYALKPFFVWNRPYYKYCHSKNVIKFLYTKVPDKRAYENKMD